MFFFVVLFLSFCALSIKGVECVRIFAFVGFVSRVAVVCPWLDFGQILPKLRGRNGGVFEEEREVRVGLKISSGKTCVVK